MPKKCSTYVFSALLTISPVFAQDAALGARPTIEAARADMQEAYASFKSLYRFLFSAREFADPNNQQDIKKALDTFSQRFNHVDSLKLSDEPGFKSSLKLARQLVDDARKQFNDGNLEFSRWRLKSLGNHCLTCHTRAKVDLDYLDVDPGLSQLQPLELGEFYLATHQFEKAREIFLHAARIENSSQSRMQALRNWLIIAARVDGQPQRALTEITNLRKNLSLAPSETQEVSAWVDSLRRWTNEKAFKNLQEVQLAERLTELGSTYSVTNYPGGGAVELLRATGILHGLMASKTINSLDRAKSLLLLGKAYSKLPLFFVDELPESFLELAIREQPHTTLAETAFNEYKDIIELGFTGSAGVDLPQDVASKLLELKKLACKSPIATKTEPLVK